MNYNIRKKLEVRIEVTPVVDEAVRGVVSRPYSRAQDGFWNADHILCLDLGAGYTSVTS